MNLRQAHEIASDLTCGRRGVIAVVVGRRLLVTDVETIGQCLAVSGKIRGTVIDRKGGVVKFINAVDRAAASHELASPRKCSRSQKAA